jgi:hypothetical protein
MRASFQQHVGEQVVVLDFSWLVLFVLIFDWSKALVLHP